jgi:hypothetical protein
VVGFFVKCTGGRNVLGRILEALMLRRFEKERREGDRNLEVGNQV